MDWALKSELGSYWVNEENIESLAKATGFSVDEIVDNPSSVSFDIASRLQHLLLKKKGTYSVS